MAGKGEVELGKTKAGAILPAGCANPSRIDGAVVPGRCRRQPRIDYKQLYTTGGKPEYTPVGSVSSEQPKEVGILVE